MLLSLESLKNSRALDVLIEGSSKQKQSKVTHGHRPGECDVMPPPPPYHFPYQHFQTAGAGQKSPEMGWGNLCSRILGIS